VQLRQQRVIEHFSLSVSSISVWNLLDVDAPRIVVALDCRRPIAVVAIEAVERTATPVDDSNAERPIVLDAPAKFVTVIDVEFPANAGGNIRLISRNLAQGRFN